MKEMTLHSEIEKILPSIKQYPASIQVSLLKYYLIFLLRNDAKEDVIAQCESLKHALIKSQEKQSSKAVEKVSDDTNINEIMLHLGVDFNVDESISEKINHIAKMLSELKENLNAVTMNKGGEAVSIAELLTQIINNEQKSKAVMNESVGGMFDRILDSLDPATAARFLDQSIERKGNEKKAAMYEAMCEKYEQLFDYHETGRLVKDFRRLYREKMKKRH